MGWEKSNGGPDAKGTCCAPTCPRLTFLLINYSGILGTGKLKTFSDLDVVFKVNIEGWIYGKLIFSSHKVGLYSQCYSWLLQLNIFDRAKLTLFKNKGPVKQRSPTPRSWTGTGL